MLCIDSGIHANLVWAPGDCCCPTGLWIGARHGGGGAMKYISTMGEGMSLGCQMSSCPVFSADGR